MKKQACTRDRPCPVCHMKRPRSGDDPCIENLPGVNFACCGHGTEDGYISFIDGRVIRFRLTRVERVERRPYRIKLVATVEDKP